MISSLDGRNGNERIVEAAVVNTSLCLCKLRTIKWFWWHFERKQSVTVRPCLFCREGAFKRRTQFRTFHLNQFIPVRQARCYNAMALLYLVIRGRTLSLHLYTAQWTAVGTGAPILARIRWNHWSNSSTCFAAIRTITTYLFGIKMRTQFPMKYTVVRMEGACNKKAYGSVKIIFPLFCNCSANYAWYQKSLQFRGSIIHFFYNIIM